MKKINLVLLTLALTSTSLSFAGKGYQVSGPVEEINDKSITVMKGKDKWELARTATTKGLDGVKKGDKVTVYYSMTAEEVEVKAAKKKK